MAKAKKKDAIATKESAEMANYDYGDDAGGGFENQDEDDYQIPFLIVLQKGSPQCDPDNAAYDKDAAPGMFMNTVSEELYDEVTIVGAITEHCFTEWKPDRGGFVGKHAKNSDVVKLAKEQSEKFGKYQTEDGNDLTENFNLYAMQYVGDLGEDGFEILGGIVFTFQSTKIKPYRAWNSKLRMFQMKSPSGDKLPPPPLFAHRVRMTTQKETRPSGTSFNVVLRPAVANLKDSLIPVGHELIEAAKDFCGLIKSGDAKVNYDKANKATGDEGEKEFEHF